MHRCRHPFVIAARRLISERNAPVGLAWQDRRLPTNSEARHDRGEAFLRQGHEDERGSDKVVMDKRGANKAVIDAINTGRDAPIVVRQIEYFNNIVEQDHRAIKHVTKAMLNFKSFRSAGSVIARIELMHMIRKALPCWATDRFASRSNQVHWQPNQLQISV
jgi:transposase-like protein